MKKRASQISSTKADKIKDQVEGMTHQDYIKKKKEKGLRGG